MDGYLIHGHRVPAATTGLYLESGKVATTTKTGAAHNSLVGLIGSYHESGFAATLAETSTGTNVPHRSWIQLAAVAYQQPGVENSTQIAWNKSNIDLFEGTDPSYVSAYGTPGTNDSRNPGTYQNTNWSYDTYCYMYVGNDKYNALVSYCTAHGLTLENMFCHFSVSSTVRLIGTTYSFGIGSRVPAYTWGPSGSNLFADGALILNNVKNSDFKAFNASYQASFMSGAGSAFTGRLVDTSELTVLADQGGIQTGGLMQEYPGISTYWPDLTYAFYDDYVTLFQPVHAAGVKHILNVSNEASSPVYRPYVDGVIRESTLIMGLVDSGLFSLVKNDMTDCRAAGVPTILAVQNSGSNANKISSLAAYYILANLMDYYCKSDTYDQDIQTQSWFGALEVNVGSPSADAYALATGTDSGGATYTVWARAYTNGFAIYQPHGDYNYYSATPVVRTLPASYKPVNADGSLGTSTNQATMQAGIGFVYVIN